MSDMMVTEKFKIENLKVTNDLKAQVSDTIFQLQAKKKYSFWPQIFLEILKYYAVKFSSPLYFQ